MPVPAITTSLVVNRSGDMPARLNRGSSRHCSLPSDDRCRDSGLQLAKSPRQTHAIFASSRFRGVRAVQLPE